MKNVSKVTILAMVLLLTLSLVNAQETLSFASLDEVAITADLYLISEDKSTPFIVLFHQAGWSRGEYLETAPKFNALGFNVMAVDQRSGGRINGVANETLKSAQTLDKGTTFVDALTDIEAALLFARANYAEGKLLALGSSYSAALVLKVAGDKPDLIEGVLSFSPGEYFARFGQTTTWIKDSAPTITVPVFITSAKSEQADWQAIFEAISSEKVSYLPQTSGNHGSRALWEEFADHEGYWQAVTSFLADVVE